MRQLPPEMPFVDSEGFPQGMVVGNARGRDGESGELLNTKIHWVRKRPERQLSPRIDSLLSVDKLQCYLREKRRYRGFRVDDSIRGLARERLLWSNGMCMGYQMPQFQTCVYLKRGTPVQYVTRPVDPHSLSSCMVASERHLRKHVFRVPKECLPVTDTERRKDPNTLCVSIWEEFLFGTSVISDRTGDTQRGGKEQQQKGDEELIEFVRRVLGYFLPKFAVDILVYTAYFLVLYASCCVYNMFWQFGVHILFMYHIKIHEKAYEKKIDVVFTGSLFQGPLYALTRNWCEHCNQRERAKVMMNLMKRMKADILAIRGVKNTQDKGDDQAKDGNSGEGKTQTRQKDACEEVIK